MIVKLVVTNPNHESETNVRHWLTMLHNLCRIDGSYIIGLPRDQEEFGSLHRLSVDTGTTFLNMAAAKVPGDMHWSLWPARINKDLDEITVNASRPPSQKLVEEIGMAWDTPTLFYVPHTILAVPKGIIVLMRHTSLLDQW